MDTDFVIKETVLTNYTGGGGDIVIPAGVTKIGTDAFRWCSATIRTVVIPDSVAEIGSGAFCDCTGLTSITIPGSVKSIGFGAFRRCDALTSVKLMDGVEELNGDCFSNCRVLEVVVLPESVKKIWRGPLGDFEGCDSVTIVCPEGSYAHRYCMENRLHYIFDYQYESFGGLVPAPVETVSSPFPADEEKPYIFISYSHKDSERIFEIIKDLYEEGWKMWYDKGLTIGHSYDKEIEKHVAGSSVFLLFVTNNSQNSKYIGMNEVPWGVSYGKPFIKCILDEGTDVLIPGSNPLTTVTLEGVRDALSATDGLVKGEKRVAKGITVTFSPRNRMIASFLDNDTLSEEKKFAYCLYSQQGAKRARSILYEIKNSGCRVYDAVLDGENRALLKTSPCLIVFLDNAFLKDPYLSDILLTAFNEKRDLAICRIESVPLPDELKDLKKIHWLNYSHGDDPVMNAHLEDYLGERGCRSSDTLPGFSYNMTRKGITITEYSGTGAEPVIEGNYNGIPVIGIDDEAFKDRKNLRKIVIPDEVLRLGENTFEGCTALKEAVLGNGIREILMNTFSGCTSLTSVTLPEHLETICDYAFDNCTSLSSLQFPKSLKKIEDFVFENCTSLKELAFPNSMESIGDHAFIDCTSLVSVDLGKGIREIGWEAFGGCTSLRSVTIPGSVSVLYGFSFCEGLTDLTIGNGVKKIAAFAFRGCKSLSEVILPDSVAEIDDGAFKDCSNLSRITIPDSVVAISGSAFDECPGLTIICSKKSYAYSYCQQKGITAELTDTSSGREKERKTGFFSRLFGRKKKIEELPADEFPQELTPEPEPPDEVPAPGKKIFDELTCDLFRKGIFKKVLELDQDLGCVVNVSNVIYLLFLYEYAEKVSELDQLFGIPIPKNRITKCVDDMNYFYRYVAEALDGGQCIIMKEQAIRLFTEKKKYTDQYGPDLENVDPDAEEKLLKKMMERSGKT